VAALVAEMKSEPLVSVENLSKRFPGMDKPALDNISLNIHPGRMWGLVGPDGAGKTTLIRLINGLLLADSGDIRVAGLNSRTDAEAIHEFSGYMPQKFGLYEELSVQENLKLYAELRRVKGSVFDKKLATLLEFTSLKPFTRRLAGKLSGGMKQKLGLACALIGNPRLLLLDEPSVGVDPISRQELWKMVRQLLAEGMTVVWSTAYLDEAEKCDHILLLNEGKSLFDGPPDNILQQVQGRTFQVRGVASGERRALLLQALKNQAVIDGVIQGKNIRIVLKENTPKPQLDLKRHNADWHAVKPCFEDAFIDTLGGGPGGVSQLASQVSRKPRNDKPVIQAQGLSKRFGDFTAVKNNSFSIYRGEIFGLLGPNGAGKSTTFKMMCGLLQPTRGEAFVTGLNLKTATSAARNRIGYMAQKFSLYGNLNVKQNLKFFSGLYGLSGKPQKNRIDMMISIFDLGQHLKLNAGDLPLGFKQRLALACAVMHEPDVLFLDEPTSGVDPITRREFWLHINSLVEKGVTVMVTTHFMDEAEYCDRIALIYRGENIATGTPDDLKDRVGKTQVRENLVGETLVGEKRISAKNAHEPTLEEAFIELVKRSELKAAV
jgi:ABC-2 type transport system ATP-binding protein